MCDGGGGTTASEHPIERLHGAVQAFRTRPSAAQSPAAEGDDLIRLRHAIDLLELEFAVMAAGFAATDEYNEQGSVCPVSWLRHNCRMSGYAAGVAVCVGEQTANLPNSVQAMSEGRIGFAHLALLARTAEALHASASTSNFDETPLLNQALEHSVSRFRHDCDHARHAGDAEAFLDQQVAAIEMRSLRTAPCGDGLVSVKGVLDSVGAATLRTALEPLARRRGHEDPRYRDRRLADALVELAEHCLNEGVLPRRNGQRPHLQVTASLETLLGLTGAPAGELEFSPPVSTVTVRRLACSASISRVLLGPKAAVLEVGRAARLPSEPTRRALAARDQGCAWPGGCDRAVSWTVPHHLVFWGHGGETDLENLVLLCYWHHLRVHEGGWQLVRLDRWHLMAIPPRLSAGRRPPPDPQVTAA